MENKTSDWQEFGGRWEQQRSVCGYKKPIWRDLCGDGTISYLDYINVNNLVMILHQTQSSLRTSITTEANWVKVHEISLNYFLHHMQIQNYHKTKSLSENKWLFDGDDLPTRICFQKGPPPPLPRRGEEKTQKQHLV